MHGAGPEGLVKRGVLGALSGGMIERIRQSWWPFRAGKPGHRFQDSYRRRQQSEGGGFNVRRIVSTVVGSAFFGWAPGPGIVTFFLVLAYGAYSLLFGRSAPHRPPSATAPGRTP
jgi:hypothetical protein